MYFDTIAKIISERTGCDLSEITPESKFADIGIDSLDTVDMLMNLEDELGVAIDLDQKIDSVADLERVIERQKVNS